ILDVPLAEVSPGFLTRDRVVLDREELEALKSSMRSHGQRMPAEITKLEPETIDKLGTVYRYGLISGWRRLTALNELYAETGEARFSKIRALLRPKREAAESYVAMVEENEIRVGLSYFERARLISEITSQGVFPDQNTALRKLFASASRAKRSKIGSFVELADQLGDLLHFPSEISERLGLALVARLRQEGGCEALRAGLKQAQPENSAAEIALLEKLLQMSATKPANKPRI
ncbi:MAG: ParB/RepB/Spo0J family partition protein, partial [Mangrovicoccus sp.]